jgi:hypothetical protein
MSVRSALDAALVTEPPAEVDQALVALAKAYADTVDVERCSECGGHPDIAKIGPALLGALEALQMSPRARAMARKGIKTHGPASTSRLDELRDRRRRKHDAPDLDAAAP